MKHMRDIEKHHKDGMKHHMDGMKHHKDGMKHHKEALKKMAKHEAHKEMKAFEKKDMKQDKMMMKKAGRGC